MSDPSIRRLVDPDLTGMLSVSEGGMFPAKVEVQGEEWCVVYVPVLVERNA